MVAVEMRDKHMVETRKFQPHAPELQLRALAAVNHEELVAEVHHLARRLVASRRRGRTASEYVDLEFCHNIAKVHKKARFPIRLRFKLYKLPKLFVL